MSADRVLVLRAAPFDTTIDTIEADGSAVRERISRVAFMSARPEAVRLLWDHSPRGIGRVLELHHDQQHLRAVVEVTDPDALDRVRSGEVRGCSVGFAPQVNRSTRDQGGLLVERVKADLQEISLTNVPAYAEAKVIGTPTEIEQARLHAWLQIRAMGRSAGLDPLPLRSRTPRSSRPARDRDLRPAASASGGVRYSAPSGRVLSLA